MTRISSTAHRLLAVALVFAMAAAVGHACSVPVFRVALLDNRWRPERYEVTLFHRGPLSPVDKSRLKQLNDFLDANEGHLNIVLDVVDLDKTRDADAKALWETQPNAALPWLVVRHPEVQDVKGDLWAGRFADAPLTALVDSPARREIAKRILAGESAVWLQIDGGDKAKDDSAFEILSRHLAQLNESITLPEIKEEDARKYQRPGAPPLKIAFSTMRLSRTDPGEKWLIKMLLAMEDDLVASKEPIVFPVFGRGIALYALMGKGISPKNLTQAATYICGECSCEVRRLNPGKDLLMAAAWDTTEALPSLAALSFAAPIDIGGLACTAAAETGGTARQTAAAPTRPENADTLDSSPSLVAPIVASLGVGLAILVGLGWWILSPARAMKP